MQIHRILSPTDFSEPSNQAAAYAFEMARAFGARLLLLHVVEVPTHPSGGFTPPGMAAVFIGELQRRANLDLAEVLSEPQDAQVEVSRQVVIGTPSRTIIDVATAERMDLIVMATHGRSGLSHLLLGSVAERVVRLAPCPVLTLRPTAGTAA